MGDECQECGYRPEDDGASGEDALHRREGEVMCTDCAADHGWWDDG
jgi:hypothetical protein